MAVWSGLQGQAVDSFGCSAPVFSRPAVHQISGSVVADFVYSALENVAHNVEELSGLFGCLSLPSVGPSTQSYICTRDAHYVRTQHVFF